MCDYEIQSDFDIKGLSLIDVSSEDDCLLINSPLYNHINPQFSGCFDEYGKLEEDETRGSGRCNIRKCLTWDSAFFSSAAFLEPEEFSKSETHTLHGIQEDVNSSTWGSPESDFVDQKSKSDTASCSVKMQLETTDSRIVSSSNKFECTNKHKVKQKAGPKKPTIAVKDSGKTIKHVSTRPQTSHSVGRSGVSTSSIHKPQKGLSRVVPISTTQTKTASLGAKDVNMGKDAKFVTGRGTTISKKPALGDSRNIVPRPKLSSRSSLNTIKQNNDSTMFNSPSSTYDTNRSKHAVEDKSRAGRLQLSTCFKSPTNLKSSVSTTSSYGEWSLESSSTTTANKRSNTVRGSLGSSYGSRKGIITNSDPQESLDSQSHHTHCSSLGDDIDVTSSLDGSETRVSDGSTGFLSPALIKPSGIRPPSSKVALYDGERSSGHTRNRSMPSYPSAPTSFLKIGPKSTNPSGSSNKAPLRTAQRPATPATRVLTASRNSKISTGITPKLQNKPSPRTSREGYSKAQTIGSTERSLDPNLPKLVVKLGGKDNARIKDTKIVPLAVPDC